MAARTRDARERRELVRRGSGLRAGERRQKGGLADRREADQRHARVARLGDVKPRALLRAAARGLQELQHDTSTAVGLPRDAACYQLPTA